MPKFIDKLLNLIEINDGDDFDDEEYEDEEEEEEVPARKKPARKPFSAREEEPAAEPSPAAAKEKELPPRDTRSSSRAGRRPTRENVLPLRAGKSDIVITRISDKMDARTICDLILSGRAIILNLEGAASEAAQQTINFVSGAVYSVNGNGGKISKDIFIFVPNSISISGDALAQTMQGNTAEDTASLRLD